MTFAVIDFAKEQDAIQVSMCSALGEPLSRCLFVELKLSQLQGLNRTVTDALDPERESTDSTKEYVRDRQLQAKMAVEIMSVDKEMGQEYMHLWKELADSFVAIRDLKFKNIDEYLACRFVDLGCPWVQRFPRVLI